MVEEKSRSAGTRRLEMVKCGKDRCKASEGPAYGPYWHLCYGHNRKLPSRYVGKLVPDKLEVQGS